MNHHNYFFGNSKEVFDKFNNNVLWTSTLMYFGGYIFNYKFDINCSLEEIQKIALQELIKALPQTTESDFELKNYKYWYKNFIIQLNLKYYYIFIILTVAYLSLILFLFLNIL